MAAENKDVFYHSTALINSAGTGKTKTAVDLHRYFRLVYVMLGDVEKVRSANNCPLWSSLYKDMFDKLLKSMPSSKDSMAMKIVYSIASASLPFGDNISLYSAQFDNNDFFGELQNCWEQYATSQKGAGVKFYDDPVICNDNPLLIVIDEAMYIAAGADDVCSNIRALRRAVTKFQATYILFLSTSSHVTELVPHPGGSQPTSSDTRLRTASAIETGAKKSDFLPMCSVSAMNYFSTPFHAFSFGRPLWSSVMNKNSNDPLLLSWMIQLAFNILKGGVRESLDDESQGTDMSDNHCMNLAMFGSRFSLVAKKELANTLVQCNGAIAVSVTEAAQTSVTVTAQTSEMPKPLHYLTSMYFPEPVLAEVAALYMSGPDYSCRHFWEVLNSLEREIGGDSPVCVDVGDIGELMAVVYLTAVLDQLKIRKIRANGYDGCQHSFIGDVSLEEFVIALWRDEELPSSKMKLLSGCVSHCYVNFSHFYRRSKSSTSLTEQDLENLYRRGCAIFCSKGFPGTDVIIPILVKKGDTIRYGMFLVRIKNIIESYSQAEADIIFAAMSPHHILVARPVELQKSEEAYYEGLTKPQKKQMQKNKKNLLGAQASANKQLVDNCIVMKLLLMVGKGSVAKRFEMRTVDGKPVTYNMDTRQPRAVATNPSPLSVVMALNINDGSPHENIEPLRLKMKNILQYSSPSMYAAFEENIDSVQQEIQNAKTKFATVDEVLSSQFDVGRYACLDDAALHWDGGASESKEYAESDAAAGEHNGEQAC
jgi:hypothetical protein